MKKNILTIADGFGVDTDFKKWPFYLKLLTTKTHNVVNRSIIGASNEMIFLQLAEAVKKETYEYCIIQWAIPCRVDLVANDFWINQAKQDSVYHFNLIDNNDKKWWVTSASNNSYIRNYHDRYIGKWHATQRSQSWIMAAAELLKFNNIKFIFSLSNSAEFLEPTSNIINSYPWAWHEKNSGLNEFRHVSQYKSYDKGMPRPHTLIQLDWIDKVLKPSCNFIDYSAEVYNNIEQSLIKRYV
jgi:hypothetical protein